MSKKVIYHISGFDCPNCAAKVERFLNKEEYIQSASIDFTNERMYITYREEPLGLEELKETIKKVESDPLRIERIQSGRRTTQSIIDKKFIFNLSRIIFSAVLMVITMIFVEEKNYLLAVILYGISALFCLYDIIWKLIQNIIHLRNPIDMNLLLTISSVGVFVLSILITYNVLPMGRFHIDLMDGVMVIVLYQVGELFEAIAVGKSRKSIKNLIDLTPKTARMYVDGNITEVEPYEINIGDLFEVLPGEKIALDGVIYKGDSYLDTKALTGESKYQEVFEGKEVLSGSININKPIIVKATKIYDDSTATKILEMVENAADKKTNSEKFISKFAKYYTPIVVLLALLLAIIPSIIYKNPSEYIRRALNFLVVSCPCALVISIPLSFFAGIGSSSKEGILVKGSNYLEMLSKAKTIVFDKTGTITKGVFEITKVEGENTLYLASICEKKSNHPIALAIKNKMIAKEDYDIEEKAGFGIIARKKSNT